MTSPIRYIATLVLGEKDVQAADKLKAIVAEVQDAAPQNWVTLCPGKAYECEWVTLDPKKAQTEIAARLSDKAIHADICVQPRDGRRKSLLICDMDSTLIGQECIDELADFAGLKDQVSLITEHAMRGEIDFEDALTERVKLLKGLPLSTLETCFRDRITLNAGARTLALTMHAHGATTVIVSGGFTFFTERVAKLAGFDHHHANTLLHSEAVLTGEVKRPILGRQAKLDTLRAYAQSPLNELSALAIGDGANDLAMIKAAGLGIAYNAKPAVAAAAHCAINYTDLTTALYFQGYRAQDFVV